MITNLLQRNMQALRRYRQMAYRCCIKIVVARRNRRSAKKIFFAMRKLIFILTFLLVQICLAQGTQELKPASTDQATSKKEIYVLAGSMFAISLGLIKLQKHLEAREPLLIWPNEKPLLGIASGCFLAGIISAICIIFD